MLWSGLHRKKIVLGTAAMSNVKLIGPPHSTLWSWLLPSTVGADFLQPWLWLSHYLIVWLYVIKISCTLSFYKSFDFGTAKKPFPGREEFGNFVMNILFFNTRRLQQIIWNIENKNQPVNFITDQFLFLLDENYGTLYIFWNVT